jgi:dienelactone hydrolase
MRRAGPILAFVVSLFWLAPLAAEPLPDTKPLTTEGDLAAQMVAGIDKYLMRELAASVEKRKDLWKPDYSSWDAYDKSVQPNREHLKKILGVVDPRVPFTDIEFVGGPNSPALVAETDTYKVYSVRWPVLEGVDGEGLLLEPKEKPIGCVIAIPDADWTPEMLVGLAPGLGRIEQIGRRLAERGCRVIVPVVIDRKDTWSGNPKLGRMTNQTHREFIYRMAYEMGRHIIGYEVQKVLAAVDWFTREKDHPPVGVIGYGEGGLLALYSGAIDTRIQTTGVSGYFGSSEEMWKEPIYRNLAGLLREFGDGDTGSLILTRGLVLQYCKGPEVAGPPTPRDGRNGAAPGRLSLPATDNNLLPAADKIFGRHSDELSTGTKNQGRKGGGSYHLSMPTESLPWSSRSIPYFLDLLADVKELKEEAKPLTIHRKDLDSDARQKRQFDQLLAFTQKLMRDSEYRRQETFWNKIDTSSLEKYQTSTAPFRKQLWEEVIGKLPEPSEPMSPRTRLSYDEPKWQGYEVTLDLYPDVFAYGILLVPKDLKPGEKRPVVVCQHGLEGRPQDVVNPKERSKYYNSFGAQLADRGYVVYAPQNPYIGHDLFRVLQRKANPLGLSLFSFIVRQHERTLDWLATLPFVDPERLAFYGLSYGGKTAMRVPAILPRYCLSICSGDFNEWTWKNVSYDYRGSYIFSGEYEMPEFNLGHTLVYAEMAALIAPRPFMVERGHDDGVGIDEWVSYEYAKVRRLYSRLKIPERTEIEYFPSGHEINGKGTFAFLQKHLHWPQ